MKVLSVELTDYRNYEREKVKLNDGLNVVFGANAQGKTNLLESIYFASIAKSLRTTKDKDLISFGKDFGRIKLIIEKNIGKVEIEIILSKSSKKTIKINGSSVLRAGELLGQLPSVYFSPDEMKLIKESPEYRRRFMDISISQFSKHYFYSLLKYEKILDHRNKLLKSAKTIEEIEDSLAIFTIQAINEASLIVQMRKNFVEKLSNPLNETHAFLTQNKEQISIEYIGVKGNSFEEIKENLTKDYEKNKIKDFEHRHTTVGPHRDDLKILLNGLDVRQFGSQGQQRTATLSLKLSELKILYESTGEKPILLLDDVLSELDDVRKEKLLEYAKNYQTILACTDIQTKFKANFIKVEKGKIVR